MQEDITHLFTFRSHSQIWNIMAAKRSRSRSYNVYNNNIGKQSNVVSFRNIIVPIYAPLNKTINCSVKQISYHSFINNLINILMKSRIYEVYIILFSMFTVLLLCCYYLWWVLHQMIHRHCQVTTGSC